MKSDKNKKEDSQSSDFLAKEAEEFKNTSPEYTLDIPEDEIWTYQIEGLQAPYIGKTHNKRKKAIVVVLLVAILFSIFLSVRAVHKKEFTYNQLSDNSFELVKYTNPGDATSVTIDFVDKDENKPITALHEYAFNCDEKIRTVTLGKDISKIDGKAFYSCWQLQNVFIDEENPYYCDLDGVIYTKDLTEIIYYPSDHDRYLRLQNGYAYIDEKGEQHSNLLDDDGKEMEELWEPTEKYDEAYFNEYNKLVRTYVVPSTVTTIGQLAFAYSNITDLYVPEGLQKIETMGIFKNTILLNVYSYTTDNEISDTSFNAISSFKTQYNSLPEGLEYIGSDAFTYNSSLTYLYIPDSVTYIGHHAFWNTVYKKDGNLKGITEINVASDEDSFKSNCKLGDDWKPKYDYKLFKKAVDVNFSATRED